MDVTTILTIALVVLLVMLVIEMPVGLSLAVSGTVGLVLMRDLNYAGSVLGSSPFTSTASFSLVIIPMFVLIGMFAVHGYLAEQVYEISNWAFRKLPGGLACATVAACAGFAAVTGSSVATAATMARLSIREMVRFGYPKEFAAGTVAAAGTLGVMIPPSIILVLYAIITQNSTAQMLAAGILPGILSAVAYAAYILVRGRKLVPVPAGASDTPPADVAAAAHPPATGEGGGPGDLPTPPAPTPFRELPWRGLFRILVLFVIVLGGIYTGLFTATESGALGALAALIIMLIERRRESGRAVWGAFKDAAAEAAQTTSMVFMIVVGSAIFSNFLVATGVPARISAWATDLDVAPVVIVAILLLLMIPLGMALEGISILVITMPLMYPVITSLGYDGVWFGIMTVKMIELGLITPPIGISVYVVSGSVRGITVEQVFRGVVPFIFIDLAVIALFFFLPDLLLWLPERVAR